MAYQEIKKCDECGANIRFIRMKNNGLCLKVDAAAVEIVPNTGMDRGGKWFLQQNGEWVRGREKAENMFYDGVDAIAAFRKHECRGAN